MCRSFRCIATITTSLSANSRFSQSVSMFDKKSVRLESGLRQRMLDPQRGARFKLIGAHRRLPLPLTGISAVGANKLLAPGSIQSRPFFKQRREISEIFNQFATMLQKKTKFLCGTQCQTLTGACCCRDCGVILGLHVLTRHHWLILCADQ